MRTLSRLGLLGVLLVKKCHFPPFWLTAKTGIAAECVILTHYAIMVPQLAVLVSNFERPYHLARVLTSLACQRRVDGLFEVVVTDDGSQDESATVVADFARRVPMLVQMTSHRHEGFQLARCRNEGVAVSQAPYLLFLDGDCLVPPDHLWHHLQHRKRSTVMAGYCCLLDRFTTERMSLDDVRQGTFLKSVSVNERRKLRQMDRRARLYHWLRHPSKPKMFGGNVGIHRDDYERVNGYDENFVGWGCEDDDLRLRLRAGGVTIQSILKWTCTYHLWHPRHPTTPARWVNGTNVGYLRRAKRRTVCENGLAKHLDGDTILS